MKLYFKISITQIHPFLCTKTLQHFLQNPGQIFDMYARVEDSGGGEVHSTGSRKINLVNSPVESFFVGFWRPLLGQVKLCPKPLLILLRGWDVSTINPTMFREGSGFLRKMVHFKDSSIKSWW